MDTRRRTPRFRYMGEGMGSPELPHPKFRENASSKTRHDGAVVAEQVPAQRGRSRRHGVAGEEMGVSIKREGARMLCGSKADLRRRWRTRSGRGGPQMLRCCPEEASGTQKACPEGASGTPKARFRGSGAKSRIAWPLTDKAHSKIWTEAWARRPIVSTSAVAGSRAKYRLPP